MEEVYDAEDDWDEDEATQYMIEQSLLEYSKHADSTARYCWLFRALISNLFASNRDHTCSDLP